MTPADRGGARYAVHFDELAFAEDLRHASPAGREVARVARRRLERDGASLDELRRCDPEHRDGTRLPNCVKTYLPDPGGRWRMVFEAGYDRAAGQLRADAAGRPRASARGILDQAGGIEASSRHGSTRPPLPRSHDRAPAARHHLLDPAPASPCGPA